MDSSYALKWRYMVRQWLGKYSSSLDRVELLPSPMEILQLSCYESSQIWFPNHRSTSLVSSSPLKQQNQKETNSTRTNHHSLPTYSLNLHYISVTVNFYTSACKHHPPYRSGKHGDSDPRFFTPSSWKSGVRRPWLSDPRMGFSADDLDFFWWHQKMAAPKIGHGTCSF